MNHLLLFIYLPIVVHSLNLPGDLQKRNDEGTTTTTEIINSSSERFTTRFPILAAEDLPDEGLSNRETVVIIMSVIFAMFVVLGVLIAVNTLFRKSDDQSSDKGTHRSQSTDSFAKPPAGRIMVVNESPETKEMDQVKAPTSRMFARNPQRNFSLTNAANQAQEQEPSPPRAFTPNSRNFSLTNTNNTAQKKVNKMEPVHEKYKYHEDEEYDEDVDYEDDIKSYEEDNKAFNLNDESVYAPAPVQNPDEVTTKF